MKTNTISIIQAQCEGIIDIPSLENLVILPICTDIFEGVLDLFPGALASYSLRKLRRGYSGPAIRVKRSSDGMLQNIGFTPEGNLDVDELMAFVGTGPTDDGFIHTLFNQSPNGGNLDKQSASGNQPKIIDAGVLQISGNFTSIFFDNTGDNVLFSDVTIAGASPNVTIFTMSKKLLLTNNGTVFNLGFPEDVTIQVSSKFPASDGTLQWVTGNIVTDKLTSAPDFNDILQHVGTFITNPGTNNQKILRDGIEIAQKTQTTPSPQLPQATIGNVKDQGSEPANMQFQEIIIYDSDQSANVPAMVQNMLEYWKYQPLVTADGDEIVTASGDTLVAV